MWFLFLHLSIHSYADLSNGVYDDCKINIQGFSFEVMCTCSNNIQIILHRCDDLHMKYIYVFNGICNISTSYNLSSSGS